MTSDTLKKSLEKITFHDVYIKKLNCFQDDCFHIKKNLTEATLTAQLKHEVADGVIFAIGNDGKHVLRVILVFGYRLALPENKNETIAEIVAEIVAEFILDGPMDEESINDFAVEKSNIYAWPYWKEILFTQLSKMRLPPIKLPNIPPKPNTPRGPKPGSNAEAGAEGNSA